MLRARASTTAVVCVCVAWYSATPYASAQQDAVVDLPQAVALATQRSHQLKAAGHAISAALAQLDEARISPFFQFQGRAGLAFVPDANGTPGYTPDPPNQLDRAFGPAVSAGLQGAIPLWTFGKLGAARSAARAGVRAAESGQVRVRAQLQHDVRRAYYALALALDTQQMLSEGLPRVEQAMTQLQQSVAQGDADADPTDQYRLATVLAEIQARSADAVHLGETALSALETLTGRRRMRIPDCPMTTIAFTPKDLPTYRARARANRPELRQLTAAHTALDAELTAVRARYFPDLALALGFEAQYVPGRTRHAYYTPLMVGAALVGRWELDFAGNHFRVIRAREKLLELEGQRSSAVEGVDIEVADKRAAVIAAQARAAAWERGHQEARRWFVSAAQNHQLGLTAVEDLVDAVSAYFKARFSHLQAIHDLNMSIAGLELAVGGKLIPDSSWSMRCKLPTDP